MSETEKSSLLVVHWPLTVLTVFYLISVILFFSAFGVGINPLEAVIKLGKGPSTTPTEPIEPVFYNRTDPEPLASPTGQSAIKSIGITFGILWWIIGMGAPAVGVLSFIAIWIGLNEKQFTFIRVCGTYTFVFLMVFWTVACGVQVYLQRASLSKAGPPVALNISALVLGATSSLGTMIYLFCSTNLRILTHTPLDLEELLPMGESDPS